MCGLLDDPIFVTVAPGNGWKDPVFSPRDGADAAVVDTAKEEDASDKQDKHEKKTKKDQKDKKSKAVDAAASAAVTITPHAGPVKPLPTTTTTTTTTATDGGNGAVRGSKKATTAEGKGKAPPASMTLKGKAATLHGAGEGTGKVPPPSAVGKAPLDPPVRPNAATGALRASRPAPVAETTTTTTAEEAAAVPASPLSGAGRAPGLGASQAAKGQVHLPRTTRYQSIACVR